MNSSEQNQILAKRDVILSQVNAATGTLADRMKGSINDVSILGGMLNQWIDMMAVQYRTAGMEIDEWFDDVMQWLQTNQFMIEEVDNLLQPNGRSMVTVHCHISNKGYGKHIVMKFTLIR